MIRFTKEWLMDYHYGKWNVHEIYIEEVYSFINIIVNMPT